MINGLLSIIKNRREAVKFVTKFNYEYSNIKDNVVFHEYFVIKFFELYYPEEYKNLISYIIYSKNPFKETIKINLFEKKNIIDYGDVITKNNLKIFLDKTNIIFDTDESSLKYNSINYYNIGYYINHDFKIDTNNNSINILEMKNIEIGDFKDLDFDNKLDSVLCFMVKMKIIVKSKLLFNYLDKNLNLLINNSDIKFNNSNKIIIRNLNVNERRDAIISIISNQEKDLFSFFKDYSFTFQIIVIHDLIKSNYQIKSEYYNNTIASKYGYGNLAKKLELAFKEYINNIKEINEDLYRVIQFTKISTKDSEFINRNFTNYYSTNILFYYSKTIKEIVLDKIKDNLIQFWRAEFNNKVNLLNELFRDDYMESNVKVLNKICEFNLKYFNRNIVNFNGIEEFNGFLMLSESNINGWKEKFISFNFNEFPKELILL